MQDLERALSEISAIRSQIARGTEFQGYGPAALAVTAALAAAGAALQAVWLDDPLREVVGYVVLWGTTAALSAGVIGAEMVTRSRRAHSSLAPEMIQSAVEQFLPAGAAGVLLTAVLWRAAPESLWMLPGLWQIVFSLGMFASCRFLPRGIFAVGVWYLCAGLACLSFARDAWSLTPWTMGLPFGIGQLLAALVLHASVRDVDGP
jgi:hypothetical protein